MKLLVALSAVAVVALVAVPVLVGSESSESPAPAPRAGEPAVLQQRADAGDAHEVLLLFSAGLDGLLVDERDAGLRRAAAMLGERLAELRLDLGPAGAAFPSDAVALVHEVLARPFSLRVSLAEPLGPDALRLQLTVACPDAEAANDMAAAAGRLLASAGLRPGAVEGGLSSAATPGGPLVFGADASQDPPRFLLALGRAVPETFRFEDTGLPEGVEPALLARYDGRRLGELVGPLARFDADVRRAVGLLELLGLVGPDAGPHGFALGFDDERALGAARSAGWVRRQRANGLFVDEPLLASDLARVPADATFASLAQLRCEGLLPLLDRIEPGTSERVVTGARALTGVDPQADLLALLGPTVTVYGSASAGGGLLSTVVLLETREPERLAAGLETLARRAEAALAGPTERRVALRGWRHGATACTSLAFPGLPVPLEPAYAVADDVLVLAASPVALALALDQLGAERSLADHPGLADLPPGGLSGLHGLRFLDAPWFLERGYGTATLAATALANALRSPYAPARDPGRLLPALGALAAGSRPWLARERVVGDDLVAESSLGRSWAENGTVLAGSPLSNAYLALAGAGVVSSIALPNLMTARLAANESAAIATLRSLASAQAQVQWSGAIDADGDGVGEYGFLAELAGARPVRGSGERLSPPVLSSAFGATRDDGAGGAVVERSGYCFQVWLPGLAPNGLVHGVAEPARGTAAVDADSAEVLWCAYAWPADPGATGQRAFFVDQTGALLTTRNEHGAYGGTRAEGGAQPAFDAAFDAGGGRGRDGELWSPLD